MTDEERNEFANSLLQDFQQTMDDEILRYIHQVNNLSFFKAKRSPFWRTKVKTRRSARIPIDWVSAII